MALALQRSCGEDCSDQTTVRQHARYGAPDPLNTICCVVDNGAGITYLPGMDYPLPETWNDGAAEAVREMVQRNAQPRTLEELRTTYDGFFNIDKPLAGEIAAAAWSEFGARCRASAVVLANESLLWQTVIDTVIRKQRDYGKENIRRFGYVGLVVRVHDKLARLEHLLAQGVRPENESLGDTVLDLVGYSVLGVMLARGTFELEMV